MANTEKGSNEVQLFWRNLTLDDVDNVFHIANEIHADLPEDREVFAERIKLFPEGCLALVQRDADGDTLCGYAMSHSIWRHQLPSLNSFLGQVASGADQYYIHDLVILAPARGRGYSQEAVKILLANAARFTTTCLISVYGTASFWSRFGFVKADMHDSLQEKVSGYGEDATYLERTNI